MHRAVVLDGHTLNPGDISWRELESMLDLTVYDRTLPQEVLNRAEEARMLFTNKVVLDKEVIRNLPELEYIGVLATGYNVVDLEAANKHNIIVTNVPAYGTYSVVQHTFALLLELTQHVGAHDQSVQKGDWSRSKDFCYWHYPLIELKDLTMGVIGFGNIGSEVARLAEAFGMKVLINSKYPDENSGLKFVSFDRLLRESDVVSLHTALTNKNKGLINRKTLSKMKQTAFIINTGRGGLINEQELSEALNEGMIAGAGLDVLSIEPPKDDNPMFKARNCIITPHIAWASRASRQRLLDIAVENVRRFIEGKPQNVVNKANNQ